MGTNKKQSEETLAIFNNRHKEFILFQMVEELGETIEGDIHVIDSTEDYTFQGERLWRVYHGGGYCFEIKKVAEFDGDTGDFIQWDYQFYSEWDNFGKCDVLKAIELVKPYVKK